MKLIGLWLIVATAWASEEPVEFVVAESPETRVVNETELLCIDEGAELVKEGCGSEGCPEGSLCMESNTTSACCAPTERSTDVCPTCGGGPAGGFPPTGGRRCTSLNQCFNGEQCIGGFCVRQQNPGTGGPRTGQCSSNAQCLNGQSCQGGVCQPIDGTTGGTPCTSNFHCQNGQQCSNGRCITGGGIRNTRRRCTSSAQCLNGQQCLNGICVTGGGIPNTGAQCLSSAQCPQGMQCSRARGVCVPQRQQPQPRPCVTALQCLNGEQCLAGVCTPGGRSPGDGQCFPQPTVQIPAGFNCPRGGSPIAGCSRLNSRCPPNSLCWTISSFQFPQGASACCPSQGANVPCRSAPTQVSGFQPCSRANPFCGQNSICTLGTSCGDVCCPRGGGAFPGTGFGRKRRDAEVSVCPLGRKVGEQCSRNNPSCLPVDYECVLQGESEFGTCCEPDETAPTEAPLDETTETAEETSEPIATEEPEEETTAGEESTDNFGCPEFLRQSKSSGKTCTKTADCSSDEFCFAAEGGNVCCGRGKSRAGPSRNVCLFRKEPDLIRKCESTGECDKKQTCQRGFCCFRFFV